MKDWFTIERIDTDTFAISEYGHCEETHCCFYEPEREYLFSGDLIYSGCLDAFYPTTNPSLFWQSVKKINSLEIKRLLPAHHQLNVPVSIIDRIEKAFSELAHRGMLTHGAGVFDFEDFQIHI